MYPCSLALTGPDARGNTHAPMLGKPGQAAVGTATRTDCRRTHVGGGGIARGSNTQCQGLNGQARRAMHLPLERRELGNAKPRSGQPKVTTHARPRTASVLLAQTRVSRQLGTTTGMTTAASPALTEGRSSRGAAAAM